MTESISSARRIHNALLLNIRHVSTPQLMACTEKSRNTNILVSQSPAHLQYVSGCLPPNVLELQYCCRTAVHLIDHVVKKLTQKNTALIDNLAAFLLFIQH
ncbi:hypothetical protein IscW_ISCW000048 [Ixodes scapularis]|uniref:Uncharacterized protein n=1 Tax=Ixodes scapularis TaxID=6945 RepID=B7P6S3_IXOSC|nr:hypothetical protein IscW_ISCW000048 [Ixodes scapularis]|eukprot:XP_002409175.1 hypothetical protein IscW_ISCW000048 [Ixodes scapularis]